MHANETLIHTLYEAFQAKDFRRMGACYHDAATFRDGAFDLRNGAEIRAMWEMLIASGRDLSVTFSDIQADDDSGSAHWEATYTFSKTSRRVHNRIDARFEFRDGLIFRHRDQFDVWRWARQAFGVAGWLLGWTPFFQNKVRQIAMGGLHKFIQSKS